MIQKHDDLFPARAVYTWAARGVILYAAIALMLWLTGCSGGGSGAAQVVHSDPPPTTTQSDPPPAPLTCAQQGYGGTSYPNCSCPNVWQTYTGATATKPGACTGTAPPVAPLPACPAAATTPLYITTCTCPPDARDGSSCVMTAPVFCPVGIVAAPLWCTCPTADLNATDGSCNTPPPAVLPPPPTMSLTASPNPVTAQGGNTLLTWSSSSTVSCLGAAGWPVAGQIAPSGEVTSASLTQTTKFTIVCSGAGGNTSQAVTVVYTPVSNPTCTPPDVLVNNTCQPPAAAFTITITATPQTVVDGTGCNGYNQIPCQSLLTVTDSYGAQAQDACTLVDSTGATVPGTVTAGWTVGPFSADSTVVYTMTCTGPASISSPTASNTVSLTVNPPTVQQPDQFNGTENADGTFTFTWQTYSQQGAGGCGVMESDAAGNTTPLQPAGTPSCVAPSCSAHSSAQFSSSPNANPYTFTLQCPQGGAPDAGVQVLCHSYNAGISCP
jgi:hypothetical protein